MTDQGYMLLFAFLDNLSNCRRQYGGAYSRIRTAAVVANMTGREMGAMLDRFDAAVSEASAMDRTGMDDAAMRQHAVGIVRRVLGG